ncbi:MAG: hypothetical protein ACM31C_18130, partial [Acidobacteriota bacterium]
MRLLFGVSIAALGCGRVGFDASMADAPVDAAPLADQVASALPCETDVVLRTVPRADELGWLDTADVQAVIALHHLDNTHHEIVVYPLAVVGGVVTSPSSTLAYATPDMYGLAFARAGAGYAAAVTSVADGTLHVLVFDAGFALQSDTPVTGLGGATVPFAASSAGQLLVGVDPSGGISVVAVDSAGSLAGAPVTIVGGPADQPAIAAVGADFAVAGRDNASGACKLARVALDGSIRAGPLSVTTPAATCVSPRVRALGTGAVAYAIHDPGTVAPIAYAGLIDPAFSAASAPNAVGATDSAVVAMVGDVDRADLAVRTNGASRLAQVLAGGTTMVVGSDFGLAGTDTDTETLQVVGSALV